MKVKKLVWQKVENDIPNPLQELIMASIPLPHYEGKASISIREDKNFYKEIVSYVGFIWAGNQGFKIAKEPTLEKCIQSCELYWESLVLSMVEI